MKQNIEDILLEFLDYIQNKHTYACLKPKKVVKEFLQQKEEQ